MAGTLTSLGTLPLGLSSETRGINDFGQVTGVARDQNGAARAFFYSAGKLHDLNNLISEEQSLAWNLEAASGINRSGAVVGTGRFNGLTRAFLALPATVIGQPVARPLGAVPRLPEIINVAMFSFSLPFASLFSLTPTPLPLLSHYPLNPLPLLG